jgi:heptosyltransferase-1
MRVLVVKMSSLGDVIHTLPALTDARQALPEVRFDWVVEEGFAEIPGWHPAVDKVIPVALRRWRRQLLRADTRREWDRARAELRARGYHAVIDAQGLVKSAFICRQLRAPRYGMDWHSAREGLATLAYDHRIPVPRDMHAVERTRLLFSRSLHYALPQARGDYGVQVGSADAAATSEPQPPGLLFFHGTAREEKLWPEDHWVALAELAGAAGYSPWLPWGSESERQRALRIAARSGSVRVLPRQSLTELAGMLRRVPAAVAVDTGLGHLAAALDVPTVSLYGPTSTRLVGAYGRNQVHIKSPLGRGRGAKGGDAAAMMAAIAPGTVWRALEGLLPAPAGAR